MRMLPLGLLLLLPLLLGNPCQPGSPRPESVGVLVRVAGDSIQVLAVSPEAHLPRRGTLQPPLIVAATRRDLPVGTSQFVAAYHQEDGRLLDAWGWSGSPGVHSLTPREREPSSRIFGAPREIDAHDRFLHLPFPEEARYLAFYRYEMVPRGTAPGRGSVAVAPPDTLAGRQAGVPHVTPLGRYWIPGPGDPPPLPPFPPLPPPPLPLPGFPDPLDPDSLRHLLASLRLHSLPQPGINVSLSLGGRIVSRELLHEAGPPESTLNLVVMGDGYTATDLDLFDEHALRFRNSLFGLDGYGAVSPFAQAADKVNLYTVRIASEDDGISHCPQLGAESRTYLDARGYWGPKDSCSYDGYIGSWSTQKIQEAIWPILSPAQVDAFVVLVNCDTSGGSAFRWTRTVFLTHQDYAEQARNLHELAHVLSPLGEEYTSCTPFNAADGYHNIVADADRENAWWKKLEGVELEEDGTFAVVRECDDPACVEDDEHNKLGPFDTPSGDLAKVGLFWGAEYSDCPGDLCDFCGEGCGYFSEPEARHWFRGQTLCLMRYLEYGVFCQVCQASLEEKIELESQPPNP